MFVKKVYEDTLNKTTGGTKEVILRDRSLATEKAKVIEFSCAF